MSRAAGESVQMNVHATRRQVIVIGVPTFGMVHVFWASRVMYNLRHPMNVICRPMFVVGREVGNARNEIVDYALNLSEVDPTTEASHIFFIDDDVLVHPEALVKLMAHNRPIISGLYYAKSSVPTPLILMGEFEGTNRHFTMGETVECWSHGMGLTLIKTEVFRRLRDETNLGVDEFNHPNWFTTVRDSSILRPDGVRQFTNYTEDVTFLRRAAALGYQPAVDTSPQTFGFHWEQKEQRAYPLAQWFEFQREGTITWPQDAGGPPVKWSREVAA